MNMLTKNIHELIKEAKKGGIPPEFETLVKDLEAFTAIYERQENHAGDQAFAREFEAKRDQLLASFNEVTRSLGITSDMLQDYFGNPRNFTEEQWKELEKVREKNAG